MADQWLVTEDQPPPLAAAVVFDGGSPQFPGYVLGRRVPFGGLDSSSEDKNWVEIVTERGIELHAIRFFYRWRPVNGGEPTPQGWQRCEKAPGQDEGSE